MASMFSPPVTAMSGTLGSASGPVVTNTVAARISSISSLGESHLPSFLLGVFLPGDSTRFIFFLSQERALSELELPRMLLRRSLLVKPPVRPTLLPDPATW